MDWNDPLVRMVLKQAGRRALTALGGGAAAISDDDLSKALSVGVVIGNELWQAYRAYRAHAKVQASPEKQAAVEVLKQP